MKTWQKPKLIVLVRNRAEEKVLDFCKSDYSGNPLGYLHTCNLNGIDPGPCFEPCENIVAS